MAQPDIPAAALYDHVADHYDESYRRPEDIAEDQFIAQWAAPHVEGKIVLDIGCGTGHLLELAAPHHYVGVDASHRMIEIARARHGEHDRRVFLLKPWPALFAGENSFDTAISTWAYPYFASVDSLYTAWRLVKPGGRLLVQGFTHRYAHRSHYAFANKSPSRLRATTPASLADDARTAGWHVEAVVGFRYLPDNPLLGSLTVDQQLRAMQLASRLLPPGLAITHLLTARKPTVTRRYP